MKGRGIDNLKEFLHSSPSPLPCGVEKLTPQGKPSPIKGEGGILEFLHTLRERGRGLGNRRGGNF